jgi:predicted kinase
MMPLVIVCGPPAAGKTSLAARIGRHFGLPVISKDAIKEALMDHLGGEPRVGSAAFAVQFAVARELLASGNGLVLEGAFFRDQTELVNIASLGQTVIISLECTLEALERRYVARLNDRHPSHRGLDALPDLHQRVESGAYGVPDLARPLLRVDTTFDLQPSEGEILAWIGESLGAYDCRLRI